MFVVLLLLCRASGNLVVAGVGWAGSYRLGCFVWVWILVLFCEC